ncbi:excisionase family DNA binding protein [Bradyrhizobium diazoefficiens]
MRKPLKLKPSIKPIPPGKHCYTIKQCAHALGIADSTTWLLIKSGKLKSFKAGGRRLITADDFEALQRGET